jgi:hypothetical protein
MCKEIERPQGKVDVAINQARHDQLIREIHHFDVGIEVTAGADLDDELSFHQDRHPESAGGFSPIE